MGFLESLTTAEKMTGVYNFNFFGLVIEHPFVLWILLPLFFLGFITGLSHTRFSALLIIALSVVLIIFFLVRISFGFPVEVAGNLLYFFISLPLLYTLGCLSGWSIKYLLRRVCGDREGGLLCSLVE